MNKADDNLTLAEKMELIKWIPIRQQERWERMKRWHNQTILKMKDRHMFMQKEIELMRNQRQRLEKLKQSLCQ